jgi:hypothetical protein
MTNEEPQSIRFATHNARLPHPSESLIRWYPAAVLVCSYTAVWRSRSDAMNDKGRAPQIWF